MDNELNFAPTTTMVKIVSNVYTLDSLIEMHRTTLSTMLQFSYLWNNAHSRDTYIKDFLPKLLPQILMVSGTTMVAKDKSSQQAAIEIIRELWHYKNDGIPSRDKYNMLVTSLADKNLELRQYQLWELKFTNGTNTDTVFLTDAEYSELMKHIHIIEY